jgi:hypothetical protein
LLSIATLAVTLGACNDQGPGETPPLATVDSATMHGFSATATSLLQISLHSVYGGRHFATPNPFDLPVLSAAVEPLTSVATPCAPTQTGVDSLGLAIDSDGDGIPDDLSVDYGVGCSTPVGGVVYTFSGQYRLQDTGNGVANYLYTTSHLSATVRDTATGDFYRQVVTGSESADFTASHATHQMDVTYEVASKSGADSGDASLRSIETSSFDPDGGSSFMTGGSLPQGTLHFGAEFTYVNVAGGMETHRVVLSTPTPIHLAFACGTGIDGGKLRGLLEGQSAVGFRFTWAGCVEPVLDLFGTVEVGG